MTDTSAYLIEKLELIGRANEDQYFRKLDRELIEKLHRKEAAEAQEAERVRRLFATVLVAVDFGPYCRASLSYADDIAEQFDSHLIALHVIDQKVMKPPYEAPSAHTLLRSIQS